MKVNDRGPDAGGHPWGESVAGDRGHSADVTGLRTSQGKGPSFPSARAITQFQLDLIRLDGQDPLGDGSGPGALGTASPLSKGV